MRGKVERENEFGCGELVEVVEVMRGKVERENEFGCGELDGRRG